MKRLIQKLPVVLLAIVVAAILILVEFAIYQNQNKSPVVCSFIEWDMSGEHVKMKLKCDDKEYESVDNNLILFHIQHPNKPISGLLKYNGYVVEVKE